MSALRKRWQVYIEECRRHGLSAGVPMFHEHVSEAARRADKHGTALETELGMVVAEHAASQTEAARDAQEDR